MNIIVLCLKFSTQERSNENGKQCRQLHYLHNSFWGSTAQDDSNVLKLCTCFFATYSLIKNLISLFLNIFYTHNLILLQKIGKNNYKTFKMLKFS